ncbi:beta strand repeat-containing protein [Flavobacterium sp. P21]|uniref:beta strand repeat-containing protein n=1 Tax=Flavobacterium sp. P21 TaxID=3423948 RepID=UPI003D672726
MSDNGSDQTINYSVKDANGCIANGSATLNKLNSPKINTAVASAVTCTVGTSTVTVTTTAGTGVGTLTYAIIAPASATSNTTGASNGIFTGLAPNATPYTFRVTDANGCYDTKSVTVNPVTPIGITATKNNDAKCKGTSTGNGTFTVSGYAVATDYTYTLTAGVLGTGTLTKAGNTLTLSNVAAGTYTVEVKDNATNCTNTASITINEPTAVLDVTAVATKINCNNDNAVITATATGGTTNYSYAVKQGAVAPLASDYGANNVLTVDTNSGANMSWTVYVKDANGCTDSFPVSLSTDPTPSVTAVLSNQCTGTGSNFTITATGSSTDPTLSASLVYGINGINGGFSTNNVFNVPAGTYTVWVKDANGCTATVAPITVNPQLTAVANVTKQLDCTATPNAAITVDITGGKSTYTYKVDPGTGVYGSSTPVTGTQFVFTGASTATTYNFEITDSNNPTACKVIVSATVAPITNPTVTATQVNITCNGANNGSVVLTGAGGSGGYTYSNALAGTYAATNTFTGLTPGLHTFYVKDNKGCSGQVDVTILEPNVLTISATTVGFTCDTTNAKVAGSVTINAPVGGTGPFQYSFNGGAYGSVQTLAVSDNGSDQTINYSVKDANGCIANGSATLNKLNSPKINTAVASAVTCTVGTSTVTVTTTAGTGVGTLTYAIIAPASATSNTTGASNGIFTGLAPNATPYTFRVTDANGCYDTKSVTVNPVTPIGITATKNNDAKCKGTSTGNGTFTVSGYAVATDYTYTLTAGVLGTGTLTKAGNTLTLSNVAAGTYTVEVKDNATNCTNTASITINEPTAVLDVTAVATKINCNNDNAVITATATGGTTNYSYAVKQGAVAPLASDYGANNVLTVDTNSGANMSWTVYVKDANGCTDSFPVSLSTDPTPSVTAVLSNQCTGTGSNFTITATGSSTDPTLSASLVYGINGINGGFSTNNVFNVPAGTYTVWVKDANGCTATAAPITVNPQLTAVANVTKQLDCTATPNAAITVDITGGKSTYTYKVDPGTGVYGSSTPVTGTQFVFTGASTATTYNFEITDSNNPTACKVIVSATVAPITNPTVTATQVNITCNGANNGSVVLTGAGGSGGYTYSNALAGIYAATNTFAGLTPGLHTFYVKDSKGCSGQVDVTILEPTALTTTASAPAFTCSATNAKESKTLTIVEPTTGTSPYQYSFQGGGYSTVRTLTVSDTGSPQTINYSVKDKNGCIFNGSVTLTPLNPPTIQNIVGTAVTCNATSSTVTVTKTAGTGVAPVVYSITGPASAVTSNTTGDFTNLAPNVTYTFRITDNNGCYAEQSYKVNPVTPIAVNGSVVSHVKCFGVNTGSGLFTVSGFSGTYKYSFDGGATEVLNQSASTISLTNLAAGTYNVLVTDEVTGCFANSSFTIVQPTAALSASYVAVNANCNVGTSKVTVTATGGTVAYKYSFVQDGFPMGTLTTSNVANLDPIVNKNWDAYVVDANGCQIKLDIAIDTDNAPTVTATAAGQCLGVGTYTITASGTGKAPLTYSITGAGSGFGSLNTFTVTASGTYNVWVKDGNGCIAQTTVPVIVNDKLTISAQLTKDVTCSGATPATITLTALGGSGTYSYNYTSTPASATGTFVGNVFTTSDAR